MAEYKAVKEKAYSVLRRHKLTTPSLDDLMHLADELGYTVLDYSKSSEESSAGVLIQKLGLSSFAQNGNSFVYKNNDIKLIFLRETMTANEKLYSLAHELGHIYRGHMKNGACCKDADMEEEHEANEFAHYLLHPGFKGTLLAVVSRHRIASIIILIALLCGIISLPVTKHVQLTRSYYGEYYVTETGHKYHTGDCSMIKDKTNIHRLTIEEYESGKYEPCHLCLPEESDNETD